MVAAIRLQPLLVDHLADEELRQRLVDGEVGVDGEHAEGPGGVVAAVLQLQRKIVEVVDAASAVTQKRANIIREPEAAEDIFEGLAGGGGEVRFRNEEWH